MTMNLFFWLSLGCTSEVVCGEMSRTMGRSPRRTENESESYHVLLSFVLLAGRAKNERVTETVDYI